MGVGLTGFDLMDFGLMGLGPMVRQSQVRSRHRPHNWQCLLLDSCARSRPSPSLAAVQDTRHALSELLLSKAEAHCGGLLGGLLFLDKDMRRSIKPCTCNPEQV
jgi:hypothetical protein